MSPRLQRLRRLRTLSLSLGMALGATVTTLGAQMAHAEGLRAPTHLPWAQPLLDWLHPQPDLEPCPEDTTPEEVQVSAV